MDLMHVFAVVVLAAIVGGAWLLRERRSGADRRGEYRGGRRAADQVATEGSQPAAGLR